MPERTKPITVYSMMICPFAQRTRLHLHRKGVAFDLREVDICRPRPEWFLNLNPLGQVPVLVNGEDVICDSSIISEYIEETFPSPLPFGKTPTAKAKVRSLVKFVDSQFIPALYRLLAATPHERVERVASALETWRWLDEFLAATGSGDFVDEAFGMAEIAIAPFFLRYEVVAYYQAFKLPQDDTYGRVAKWRDTVLEAPGVRETAESATDLIKLYEDYAHGYFNGAVPPGRPRSSLDLNVPLQDRPLPKPVTSLPER
jgi:glutathione S-transferase